MEQEFIRMYEVVKKAADVAATSLGSQVEENRCLDAFKLLKKFPVNYEILLSTQVGKHLRVLTRHPIKMIRDFATDLVNIWKAIVLKEISKSKKQKNYQKVSKVEKMDKNATSKSKNIISAKTDYVQHVKVDEMVRKSLVIRLKVPKGVLEKTIPAANLDKNDEKKHASQLPKKASSIQARPLEDKTMIKTGNGMRDKIRETLQEALSRVSGEANKAIMDQAEACDPIRISVAIESVLFKKWGSFDKEARSIKNKYRSLIFNLKDQKNPDFRRRVLLGEIKPDEIVDMRTRDMASDERKKEFENIKMKGLLKCEHGQKQEATTDQFVCGKCQKRECTYYQMQTRSADEPMTTYVICVSCNHHWKFC